MSEVKSYKKMLDLFNTIAERHPNINTFFVGRNEEVGEESAIVYPMLQVHLDLDNSDMPQNEVGDYPVINLAMNVKIVDLLFSGKENEKDIQSDTLGTLQQIINDINQNPFYTNSNVVLRGDIALSDYFEFNDDFTAGAGTVLNFQLFNDNTWCGLPFTDIIGYDATPPVCPGATVQNSDGSYSVNVASNSSMILPDTTITINGSAFSGYPSSVSSNIVVEDTAGTAVGSKIGEVWQVPTGATADIYYNRPWLVNITSYDTYDEGDRILSGANDYNEAIPADGILQEIDFTDGVHDKLRFNNLHGHKFRFTGLNGGYYNQADSTFYTSGGSVSDKATEFPYYLATRALIVDHFSGYMMISDRLGALNYDANLAEVPTTNIEGYTDWFVPSLSEWQILENGWTPNLVQSANREPFNMSQNTHNTCTTYHPSTGRYVIWAGNLYGGTSNATKATAGGNRAFWRVHLTGTIPQ